MAKPRNDKAVMTKRALALRAMRAEIGYTQKEMAEAVGVGVTAYGDNERAVTMPQEPVMRLVRLLLEQHRASKRSVETTEPKA